MPVDQERLQELLGRAVGDLSAGYGGVMVSIGDKLGLYQAMAGAGPLGPAEVARGPAAPSATCASGSTPRRPGATWTTTR